MLSSIKNVIDKKKRPDNESIYNHVSNTGVKNVKKKTLEDTKQNVIVNKKTPKGLDSFPLVEIPRTQITGTNGHEGGEADQGEEILFLVSEDLLHISEVTYFNSVC